MPDAIHEGFILLGDGPRHNGEIYFGFRGGLLQGILMGNRVHIELLVLACQVLYHARKVPGQLQYPYIQQHRVAATQRYFNSGSLKTPPTTVILIPSQTH